MTNSQRGGFLIDGGSPFNPPQDKTMPSHYDHPARIMAAEAQIASLKAALREALDGWEFEQKSPFRQTEPRIAELRKFLDDK